MRSFTSLFVSFCVAALVLSGCLTLSREAGSQKPRFVTETEKQAQAQFAEGRYRQALEVYASADDKYHDAELRRAYARMGEQIVNVADAAYRAGAVAQAGINYRILLESGITARDVGGTLSFKDDYLDTRIKACSKALMESGLIKYREEMLDEAISLWKKALAFDPENRNIKSACETAALQLQRLKKIK
jgi:tetratricopeptide (TPR) repeat protein